MLEPLQIITIKNMIIYESDYITIQYLEEHKLLERNWKPSSAEMNHEQFQYEMLQVLKGAEEYKPVVILGDTKNFLYVILPDADLDRYYCLFTVWAMWSKKNGFY